MTNLQRHRIARLERQHGYGQRDPEAEAALAYAFELLDKARAETLTPEEQQHYEVLLRELGYITDD